MSMDKSGKQYLKDEAPAEREKQKRREKKAKKKAKRQARKGRGRRFEIRRSPGAVTVRPVRVRARRASTAPTVAPNQPLEGELEDAELGQCRVGRRSLKSSMASVTSNLRQEAGWTALHLPASRVRDEDSDIGGMRGKSSSVPESLVHKWCQESRARGTTREQSRRGEEKSGEAPCPFPVFRELTSPCSRSARPCWAQWTRQNRSCGAGTWRQSGRGWRKRAETVMWRASGDTLESFRRRPELEVREPSRRHVEQIADAHMVSQTRRLQSGWQAEKRITLRQNITSSTQMHDDGGEERPVQQSTTEETKN